MKQIKARFYDGKSSRPHDVLIIPSLPGHIRVAGDGIDFRCALGAVRVSSRLGNTPRHIQFADGGQCETNDNDAIDELLARVRAESRSRLLHTLESRSGYVLAALVTTLALLWIGIGVGIPALARQIAFHLPATTETLLGQEAMDGLDRTVFRPTRLPASRQAELRKLFAEMTSGMTGAGAYKLEMRASDRMGPNAFALPSGIVVVTDTLVAIAQNDDELIGVLAHELGHLRHRHGLRMLLQNSAVVVLTVAITGDLTSVISLGAGVPTLLLNSKYSRDFEREADDAAFEYLRERHIRTESFAAILRRIEKKAQGGGHIADYLSTHPATSEREERFGGSR